MTCYECAYFGIEWNEFLKKTIEFCNHPEKYIPPVGFAYKEIATNVEPWVSNIKTRSYNPTDKIVTITENETSEAVGDTSISFDTNIAIGSAIFWRERFREELHNVLGSNHYVC